MHLPNVILPAGDVEKDILNKFNSSEEFHSFKPLVELSRLLSSTINSG